MIGYEGRHNYVVWIPEIRKIKISPHVVFHEDLTDEMDPQTDQEKWKITIVRSLPEHARRQLTKANNDRAEHPERGDTAHNSTNVHFQSLREFTETPGPEETNFLGDPRTVIEALKDIAHDEWKEANYAEIEQLLSKGTFKLVQRPNGAKLVTARWVLKTKYVADGSIEKRKARLMARGLTQTAGVEYHETYAHIARTTSWRILLALAAINDWYVGQIDAVGAYLNGVLEENDLHGSISTASAILRRPPGQGPKPRV